MPKTLEYLSGFANHFSSEIEPGLLPIAQNSPQKLPRHLVAEQLSGSAFTTPRKYNYRTWFYRTLPMATQGTSEKISYNELWQTPPFAKIEVTPERLLWLPLPEPKSPKNFVQNIQTLAVNGDATMRVGSSVHLFSMQKKMLDEYFLNSDGDLLIVPYFGKIMCHTEFGDLEIEPGEILVIPRGMIFQLNPVEKEACGYLCENFGAHFELPDLGPIGSNGLANPRDFKVPTARYTENSTASFLITKFGGSFFRSSLRQSPFNVLAWHGNYVPYKYDLRHFNTINTVSFDHPDPSIFTVLTSPTTAPGVANVDFVVFPPRWMVAEHTFKPPWYHRNIMSEYMGLITGVYDAKSSGTFAPGCGLMHNCMAAHGPDFNAYKTGISEVLKPFKYEDTLAFMFESSLYYLPTSHGLDHLPRMKEYWKVWQWPQ